MTVTTELPASLGAELRALGWFALPEDEARAALTWKRRCEDRDERIERLCRAVAALRVENTAALADAFDAGRAAQCIYESGLREADRLGGPDPQFPVNPYRKAQP